MKKLLTILLVAVLCLTTCFALVGCNPAGDYKIAVIPFADTADEQLEWNAYLEEYVAKQIEGVSFHFVPAPGTDSDKAVTAVENAALAGCKGILGIVDSPAAIEKANELGLWYVRAGGLSTQADYDKIKNLPYYLGTMGPSLVEEEQAGYDMVKHYVAAGKKNILIYAGLLGLGFPSDMHSYRFLGVIKALKEAGCTYEGPTNSLGFATATSADLTFGKGSSDLEVTVIHGIANTAPLDPTFDARLATAISGKQFDAVVMTVEGCQTIKTLIGAGHGTPEYSEVGSFNGTVATAFNDGVATYLVGKYASSMGPAVVALINAIDGHADIVRNADGTGCRMVGPFWVAKSKAEFDTMRAFDSVANPAFNKELLEKYIVRLNPGVTRESFTAFAGLGYSELAALRK